VCKDGSCSSIDACRNALIARVALTHAGFLQGFKEKLAVL
jgi:hypothetical protein